jgi:hypothetical protein
LDEIRTPGSTCSDRENDRIAEFLDDLSSGPINPCVANLRAQWAATELACPDWEEISNDDGAFWTAALSSGDRRIAWISRRSAQEYSGFLEFIWRLGDKPCEIIDLTNQKVIYRNNRGEDSSPFFAGQLSSLHAYQIIGAGLLDRAQILTSEMRQTYKDEWAKLRIENAALRRVGAGLRLISAPISCFDHALLSHATPNLAEGRSARRADDGRPPT